MNSFFITVFFILVTLTIACTQGDNQDKKAESETPAETTAEKQAGKNGESDSEDSDAASDDKGENATGESAKDKTEKAGDENIVVATVNGNPIYRVDLKSKPLPDLINDEIFYIEGVSRGLDEKFAKQVNDYKKRLIVSDVRRKIFSGISDTEVTEQQMKEYYKENMNKYMTLTVREIYVDDRAIASEIREKALAGKEFNDIAFDYEDKGIKVYVKEFVLPSRNNHLFNKLEVGSISDIIKGVNKFGVLKITNIRRIPLQKAMPGIKHNILSERKAEIVNEFAKKYKEENNITVDMGEN